MRSGQISALGLLLALLSSCDGGQTADPPAPRAADTRTAAPAASVGDAAPLSQSGQNYTFATSGDLQIVGRENQYDIILPTDVLFDFDKSELRSEAGELLAKVKAHFAANAVDQLHVKGHTDSKGSDQYNYVLSQKRALAVCNWLKREVPDIRGLRNCIGRGEEEPLATNENPDGSDNEVNRQKNRRVTLSVIKNPDVNAMIERAREQSRGALKDLP